MRTIYDLRDPLGRPRFYPPGRHPAMARCRETLQGVKRFIELHGDHGVALEVEADIEQRLADFEAEESEAKARAYHALTRDATDW
jgi:hypothetical protein